MGLKELSREDKEKIYAALEEKKRREFKKKPVYTPNAGQIAVHKSTTKDRYTFSGNGSGKTTLLVQEAWAFAMGKNPWTGKQTKTPANVIVVLDTARKITERFIPELQKWVDLKPESQKRLGKPYTSRIQLDNGSVIDFYSADADPSSFEGIEASAVLIDEPIPRPLWTALRRSLRRKGHPCRLLFCGTAVSEAWLRRDVYEPWSKHEEGMDHIECFRVHSKVNQDNLEKDYLETFAKGLTDSEKEVRLSGGFFDSDTLALAHLWKREIHIVREENFRYTDRMPCIVAIDPHSVKPHHAVLITVDKQNNIIVAKEISRRSVASQFAAELKAWAKGYYVIDWVSDCSGSAEATSLEGFMSFIDKLQENGIPVRATTWAEKDHEDLIDRFRSLLLIPDKPDQFGQTIPKLRVLSSCTGVIGDVESVGWQKHRGSGELRPKLDTSCKDYLSCVGYALAANLFFEKPRKSKPVVMLGSLYGVTPTAKQRVRAKMRIAARGYARRMR